MRSGPVAPTSGAHAALWPLPYDATTLDEAGHLGAWQRLNREATIPHCLENLESSGAWENLRRAAKGESGGFRGMWFADSDVHKTLEAVAWAAGGHGHADRYAGVLDESAALLREAQQPDGYLNSWYQVARPEQRWRDLAWGHEMYCAGHLGQAAVAAARVAGHDDLLAVARRFADLLVTRFGADGEEGYCGHPEVETALVELYRSTGHEPYLALASRMVELRGRGLLEASRFGARYFQDHAPVREATEATGHAVRQLYLAAGVTDVAVETRDASLLAAMEALFDDMVATKAYVTGGVGSRHRDEAFGDPYELPPDRAYAETCAAIASVQWCWRLLLATGRGRYADEMERVLLNAVAVSTSRDGRAFTYSNPLQLRPGHDGSTEDAPSGRLPWFTCACCPPNLARLVASLHHYVATRDDDGVQLHLHAAGALRGSTPAGAPLHLDVATDYPWDGRVTVTVVAGAGEWALGLRVPGWCDEARLAVAGEPVGSRADEHGYVRLRRAWRPGDTVVLDLPMPTRVLRAHPRVDAVRGCVALARGPLVYCVEQADTEPGVDVDDLRLDPTSPPQPVPTSEIPGVPVVLRGPATVVPTRPRAPLYADTAGRPGEVAPGDAFSGDATGTTLTAVPYVRWGNRGPGAMRVWVPTTGSG